MVVGTCASKPWLIASLSPHQRTLLGFPAVDSPYWTEYTLDAVAERYGPMLDMSPYRESFAARFDRASTAAKQQQPLQRLTVRLTQREGYDPADIKTIDGHWHYQEGVRWTLPEPTLCIGWNNGGVGYCESDPWGRPEGDSLTPIQVGSIP